VKKTKKKEKEGKIFWPSGNFLVWYFIVPLVVLSMVKTLEDEQ